jgi:hypothetical protein
MGAGISRSAVYGRVVRGLEKIGREARKAGGSALYANWELNGSLNGHVFRVYYGSIGPASNGESCHYPVYSVDGKCVSSGLWDRRSLLDHIAEADLKLAA